MATKDRTALKDEFKNGNLATGERFADLIDSMKVVQEPVADPAASGTSLSFIDSISQDADGKITATKKTLDLSNAHELNPFKGWYKTGDILPTDGFDGAYLYFKDTSEQTGLTTIYRWNGTAYADTGTVVDTSNVNTFETGQALNAMAIDGTGLDNPASNALAKAVDVAVIKESLSEETEVGFTAPLQLKIDGETLVTAADTFPEMYQRCWYIPVSQGDNVKCIVTISPAKTVRYGFCQSLPADGVSVVESKSISGTNVEIKAKSPVTGYFVINHTTQQVATTHKFYIVTMSLPDRIKENLSETGYFFAKDEDITTMVRSLPAQSMIVGDSGKWAGNTNRSHVVFPVVEAGRLNIVPGENPVRIAFLATYTTPVAGNYPDYVDGTNYVIITTETSIVVPDGTNFIVLNRSSDVSPDLLPSSIHITGKSAFVGAGIDAAPANNIIHYFELDINPQVLVNGEDTGVLSDNEQTVKSSFGVRFPATYTPDGKPSRVLAMFHGYNGYVSGDAQTGVGSVLGYTNSSGWVDFQDVFVNAGYVVFDINGYGLYAADNNNSHHWGGPGAVLTAKKAFEYLKEHYNVYDKMLIFGFSMGGCIAWSYAMNFPCDVEVLALHEPAVPTNNEEQNNKETVLPTIAAAYGYASWTDAEADSFGNMVGFSLPLALQRYDNGVANFGGVVGLDISHSLPSGTELIGTIPCPLRIWQGTAVEPGSEGESVAIATNENIVGALRKAGCNATIRLCPGLTHSQLKQTQYVVDETLYFLNRYK